jgi:hypothetical protein
MFRSDDMENLGYFVSNPAWDDNDGVAMTGVSPRMAAPAARTRRSESSAAADISETPDQNRRAGSDKTWNRVKTGFAGRTRSPHTIPRERAQQLKRLTYPYA